MFSVAFSNLLRSTLTKANGSVLLSSNNRCYSSDNGAKSVGFIGLGNMGLRMAKNIEKKGEAAGYKLRGVYDTSAEAMGHFPPSSHASSPSHLCSLADTIITMLPSSPHVKSVYGGDNGIFAGMQKDRDYLFIDASTIDPETARAVAKQAKEEGGEMVDGPVSGGVGGAEGGTLTFMVGAGCASALLRARPLLQLMGSKIVHCGDNGTGQVVKVCNNLVLAISMIGVSEAMNLGVKLGMDPKVMAEIFNTSSARCWSSDTYNPVPGVMPNVPASRDYQGGFGVDLMLKDVGLAVDAAEAANAKLPLGSVAQQVYSTISKKGGGLKDFGVIYDYLSKNKF